MAEEDPLSKRLRHFEAEMQGAFQDHFEDTLEQLHKLEIRRAARETRIADVERRVLALEKADLMERLR